MPQIYLYREPVDFRKSFRGLAAIVEQKLGHNPFEGRCMPSPTGGGTRSS
ncbi:IS66 family insertion sequence element accessory protein TnpB, partial [Thiolapillus sp.]